MFTIDGQTIARKIRENLKQKIAASGTKPGLAAILVGDDPASKLYVSLKEKACAEVGINFEKHIFPDTTPEETIIKTIEQLNDRSGVHGILVQLPLPPEFDTDKIIAAIDPKKDVDGFTPHAKIEPVLGKAVWTLISAAKEQAMGDDEQRTKSKEQASALIIGKGDVFLKTLSDYLTLRGLTVKTISPKDIKDIGYYDIIVVAMGRASFLKADNFKDGAIVIDVGINKLPDGRVVGDVDFDSAKNKEIWITPVPGGVGPVTVATLLENTYLLAQRQKSPPEADAPFLPAFGGGAKNMIVTSSSLEETLKLGRQLTNKLKAGDVLALSGELGAGKTVLIKGLAAGLGIKRMVRSPSFNLMRVYKLPRPVRGIKTLAHLDCYRLTSSHEAMDIGLLDYLTDKRTLTVIEWPEKIKKILPKNRTKMIRFKILSENVRRLTLL